MEWTNLLIAIQCIAILYVGYIQHKQGISQATIITNLKDYTSIIDIDKLRQYVKFGEEATLSKAANLGLDRLMPDISKVANEGVAELEQKYMEYMLFSMKTLYTQTPEIRATLLNNYFPKNKEQLVRIFLAKENSNKASSPND